jgi:hypothetical protein
MTRHSVLAQACLLPLFHRSTGNTKAAELFKATDLVKPHESFPPGRFSLNTMQIYLVSSGFPSDKQIIATKPIQTTQSQPTGIQGVIDLCHRGRLLGFVFGPADQRSRQ